ncbi:Palmitoyltransferase Zdhhc15 [Manis pentadactyla]|nr:Palmitoyltransferase Zdhhc15 [Manis pentadactyla]
MITTLLCMRISEVTDLKTSSCFTIPTSQEERVDLTYPSSETLEAETKLILQAQQINLGIATESSEQVG